MAPPGTSNTPQPQTPRRIAMSRSVTVPPRLSLSTRAVPTPEIGAAEGIETLYIHPSANIIKFTTSTSSRPSSSSSSASPGRQTGAGTASWRSSSETTLAAGPMEIYRVPGSVSFLHSGALLHAILPRSQCWCVDGVSKFAFRVLPETYYRIELPGETAEDLEAVEALKTTLRKVLFYERTACPFARGFEVPLPKEEIMVRKTRRKSSGPAKKWKLDRAYSWKPEDGEERRCESRTSSTGTSEESDMEERSDEEDALDEMPDIPALQTPTRTPIRPATSVRSVTAPMQLGLRSTPPSRLRSRVEVNGTVTVAGPVQTGLGGEPGPAQIRTFQAIPTDMPPSPPDSSAGAEISERSIIASAEESSSEAERTVEESPAEISLLEPTEDYAPKTVHETVASEGLNCSTTAESPPQVIPYGEHSLLRSLAHESTDSAPQPLQPSHPAPTPQILFSTSPEDPFALIQARIQARRSIGGTTSFLPRARSPTSKSQTSTSSSATLSSLSSRSSTLSKQRSLTTALMSKFLGPPTHLVVIMLRIAARFAEGWGGGVLFVATPEGVGRRVPGSFDLRDDDEGVEGGLSGEEWEEDDFGVPLRSPIRRTGLKEGRGWEVD